jgi:hypothetical protein
MESSAMLIHRNALPSKRSRFLLLLAAIGWLLAAMAHAGETTQPEPVAAAGADETWHIPVTLGKDGWMIYENPRFGFALPVPPGMKTLRPPENGDGQAFASLDNRVKLSGWGSFNVENLGDVEARWKDALAEPNRTITYQRKTESWFVVSGVTKAGMGFYEKYTANKNYGAGWTMTYPQADEKKYAPWIERIASGYQPRLGQGHDALDEDGAKAQ